MIKMLEDKLPFDGPLKLLRRGQNLVFVAQIGNTKKIIRVTDSKHRSKTALLEEIRLLNNLGHHLQFICKPQKGPQNKWIETVDLNNETKYITFFEQAKGQYPDLNCRNDVAIIAKCLAQLHHETSIHPQRYSRRLADESPYFQIEPDSQYSGSFDVLDWWENLKKENRSYGLIHGDFNASNMKLYNGQVKLFDFDDCCYHWYDYEIANTIYMFMFANRKSAIEKTIEFFDLFLLECSRHKSTSFENVKHFITYRVCLLNTWIKNTSKAPLFIKTAQKEWIDELNGFIACYFDNFINALTSR